MEKLCIPVALERNLALLDGSTEGGFSIDKALQFDQNEVSNLYSISGKELRFSFQEHGVAYNETSATDYMVKATVQLQSREDVPGFTLKVDLNPVEMWGINFTGRVIVKHASGEERMIYLPGTRTYDPAGLTGDPHASERIGPSCSRTQIGISIAELTSALKGARLDQVNDLHSKILPLVERYHGRKILFDWMKCQVEDAIYRKTEVTPYPEYIKALILNKEIELNESREHTKAYLQAYNKGAPHPPIQYFRKVAKKDKVEEILTEDNLATFKNII